MYHIAAGLIAIGLFSGCMQRADQRLKLGRPSKPVVAITTLPLLDPIPASPELKAQPRPPGYKGEWPPQYVDDPKFLDFLEEVLEHGAEYHKAQEKK
jgi:hypothetical protein